MEFVIHVADTRQTNETQVI